MNDESAPWPNQDGYIHSAARLDAAVRMQVEQTGPIVPLYGRALADFQGRDVGASLDQPQADVFAIESQRMVLMRTDERTAAVAIHAVRLLVAQYSAHARELRMVAAQMPQGSYGEQNRLEIAVRNERIAYRGLMLEVAYRRAVKNEFHGLG